MPHALINGVELFYEEFGQGVPLLFAHEWGGDHRSWGPQVRFFARRYRTITFSARGYPPSAVPRNADAYSQELAVNDIRGLLDHLAIRQAHVCGLSMGAYATLLFGLAYPDRTLSLTVAGGGYGSGVDREQFRQATLDMAHRLEAEGIGPVAEMYARGLTGFSSCGRIPRAGRSSRAGWRAARPSGTPTP